MTTYDESLRVPFLLHWPARVAAATVTDVTTSVDVWPTVAGLLGLPPRPHAAGQDLSPLLLHNNNTARRWPPTRVVSSSFSWRAAAQSPEFDPRFTDLSDHDVLGVYSERWVLTIEGPARAEAAATYSMALDDARGRGSFECIPTSLADLGAARSGGGGGGSPGGAAAARGAAAGKRMRQLVRRHAGTRCPTPAGGPAVPAALCARRRRRRQQSAPTTAMTARCSSRWQCARSGCG